MYQGGLKPPPGGSFSKQEIDAMVETGLNEKIPVSGGGLSKTRGKIDDINQTVSGKIADGAAAGKTVDPVKVAAETQRSEKAFTTVDPADKEPIAGVRDRFLEKNSNQYKYTKVRPAAEDATGYVPEGQGVTKEPRPIPVDEAQKLKSNTYRDIRESYGEQSSAVREAKKDLARGLKEGIYEHYPELRTLGKQEKVLIDLENALERFSNRHGNRDVVSVGGPLKVLAATAMGHPGTGLVGAALEMPGIKSRLAIALKASTRAQRSAARGRQITNAVTRETAATEQQ